MRKLFRFGLLAFFTIVMQCAFAQPSLTGKIVYHTYSDYNAWDSRIYVLDLSTGSRTNISAGWNIDHEMNAHWSPDGTKLVFMGDVAGEPRNWDIFIWTVGTSQPINLTNGGGRDEDPKFSPDGQKIVFKRDNDLWQMQLNGAIINNVTNTPGIEESMPYYTADGGSILYAPGVGAGSDIYRINTNGTGAQALVAQPNVQEYFPITRDNNSFFYTAWRNSTNLNDQIYLKPYSGSATLLPFNTADANYSDAYAVGSQYVLFSSTRAGGKGGYDLYIANISTGQTWSLDSYNSSVNSSGHDLAAVYNSSGTPPPPPPTQSPYGGSAWAIPGKIESENYDNGGQGVAYNDNTAGNSGGVYRNDGVDLEGTTDTGGGYNVGYIATGEWLEYTVNVTATGTYTLQARVAAAAAGGRLHVEMDGVNVSGSVTVPSTGGWQTWQTVSVTTTSITSGQKVMRLYVDAGGFNINHLNFSTSGGGGQTPYGGTAWAVPGKIEAENYDNGGQSVAYFDLTTGNSGGVYRSNDVDLEGCADTGGGYDVGGIGTNEWLEYTINVATTRTYTVSLRVATAQAGGRVRVEINGVSVGTVNIPNTGGWQTWQSVSFTSTSISAGQKVLRLFFEVGNFNLNHITFSTGSARMTASTLKSIEDDLNLETSKILCYPNPVRDITTVKVEVSKPGRTEVSLVDVSGKKANIYEGDLAVGSHEFQYDAQNLKAGFYLLKVSGVGTSAVSKLIKLD